MHLHGHSFRVSRRNGIPVPNSIWSDTVLLAPRDSVDVTFVADNPSDWMVHCHVIDHQTAGMMAVISIDDGLAVSDERGTAVSLMMIFAVALAEDRPKALLYKSPQCGCCEKYVAYRRRYGFDVTVKPTHDLANISRKVGCRRILRDATRCSSTVLWLMAMCPLMWFAGYSRNVHRSPASSCPACRRARRACPIIDPGNPARLVRQQWLDNLPLEIRQIKARHLNLHRSGD